MDVDNIDSPCLPTDSTWRTEQSKIMDEARARMKHDIQAKQNYIKQALDSEQITPQYATLFRYH